MTVKDLMCVLHRQCNYEDFFDSTQLDDDSARSVKRLIEGMEVLVRTPEDPEGEISFYVRHTDGKLYHHESFSRDVNGAWDRMERSDRKEDAVYRAYQNRAIQEMNNT